MNVFRFCRQMTSTLIFPPAGIAGNRNSTCSRHFYFCTQTPRHPWFKIDYGNWQRAQLQDTPARSIPMKRWPGVSCGDAAPVAMSQISVELSTSGKTLCVKKPPQKLLFGVFFKSQQTVWEKEANFFAIVHFFKSCLKHYVKLQRGRCLRAAAIREQRPNRMEGPVR